MARNVALTSERLREVITYSPETGKFNGRHEIIWHRNSRQTQDYVKISIDGKQYLAHRLAWFYVYGRWPVAEIDHINGNGLDNRLCNLREANRAQNSTNSPAQKSNKVGLRGVHFHQRAKRYRAQITKAGSCKHLGYFDTPQQAYDAYLSAAKELHGEFVRQ